MLYSAQIAQRIVTARIWHTAIVAVFLLLGMNPSTWMDWVLLMGLARDKPAIDHIKYLQDRWEKGIYEPKYVYSYHVANGRYEYLNGDVKILDKKHLDTEIQEIKANISDDMLEKLQNIKNKR